MLDAHLEQIQLCSSTIAQLPFPPPKIFTNAMLHATDITSLIRDTEAHERALFSIALDDGGVVSRRRTIATAKRRATGFTNQTDELEQEHNFRAPRKGKAVAAVLGGDLHERIRKEFHRDSSQVRGTRRQERDDFDVELLLAGAQRLCSVYPIPGALERIVNLRNRNDKVTASLEKYEELVVQQAAQLGRMNGVSAAGLDDEADEELVVGGANLHSRDEQPPLSDEDLRREEERIAELERKKRTLEERVNGIEKDLGGLLR